MNENIITVSDGSVPSSEGTYNPENDQESNPESYPVNDPVIGDYNDEDFENSSASDPDNRQSDNLLEMLRYDLVTYINFSYKMQICQVALLALLTGGVVAVGIFNHFKR